MLRQRCAPPAAAPAPRAPRPPPAPPRQRIEVRLPDMGNFAEVGVIDVLVKSGDPVAVDTPLVTLETEKATMDVPSTAAGVVEQRHVASGRQDLRRRPRRHAARRRLPACDARSCSGRGRRATGARCQRAVAASGTRRCRRRSTRPGFSTAHASPVGAQARARAGRRSGPRQGHGARGRITHDDVKAYVKQLPSPAPRRAQAAWRCRPCRSSISPGSARSRSSRCPHAEDLRRAAARQLGEPAARHAVRRGRHHGARGHAGRASRTRPRPRA